MKLNWPRLTRVEGFSGKIPSREMMHCCFTNPSSAGYHINLGCLTEVFCSYLGIIFTGVNPGLASPQVGIPLFSLKNQTEVLIPLLTPINSAAVEMVPFLCLRQGQLCIEQIPESKLQILSSFYHKPPQQTHRSEAGDTDTSWCSLSLGNGSPATA